MIAQDSATLGAYQGAVDAALKELQDEQVVERLWAGDHTIWKPDPEEISNRLGWLRSPSVMMETLPEIEAFVEAVREAGYSTAVTLDQGRAGSSSDPMRLRRLYAGNNTSRAAIRAFTVPAIGPAYRLINLAMRGLLGRKRWPGPSPGTVQSTETVPMGVTI